MAAELKSLVDRELVRVLDLVIVRKEADGSVEAAELADVDESNVGELLSLEADLAMLLAEDDVMEIGRRSKPAASRPCSSTRTPGPDRSPPRSAARAASSSPADACRRKHCWPRSKRTRKPR